MRRMFLILLSLLLLSSAFATWSVIAIDQVSNRVVIASATCVEKLDDLSLMSIQAVVVPGKGVAACQALVDPCHRNQMLVFNVLQNGTPPEHNHRFAQKIRPVLRKTTVRYPRCRRPYGRSLGHLQP